MPEYNVSDAARLTPVLPFNVPVNPLKFKLLQSPVVVATVTVEAPELASKKTLLFAVGSGAPPLPPDVKAHLLPAVPFHDAVPPTQ